MTYDETVRYLYDSTPVFEHVGASAYKEGLDDTQALDEHFGHPHRCYKTIHVAGTNGKGSCSHTLAAILQSAGWKVGLYTSPHLVDFRERIRVNGMCISEKRIVDFVEQERSFFEPLHPSFFELTTALAFKYFAEQQVDIAVIEVGLGGRLDCTNIITPLLSVITNISFDHTRFLGNTLAKIAGEKAGIIKKGVPVVIGETTAETRPVFAARAREVGAPIRFAEDAPVVRSSVALPGGGREYRLSDGRTVCGELSGDYQEANMNTVLTAVEELRRQGIALSESDVEQGIAAVSGLTGLMGRWQRLRERPLAVCDTGHNVGGWNYLVGQIKAQPCHRLRIVFGMVDDKDIDRILAMLPREADFYWTQASSHRAIPAAQVAGKAAAIGLRGRSYATVGEAWQQALADASPEDFIFVGGSSYVVADLLALPKAG